MYQAEDDMDSEDMEILAVLQSYNSAKADTVKSTEWIPSSKNLC